MDDLLNTRAVIFDCDGVLIDSWDSTLFFYNRIRQQVGLPPLNPEQEAFVFVSTTDDGIRHTIPPQLRRQAFRLARAVDWGDVFALVRLQPGILDLLDILAVKRVKRAVNTNGGREVHHLFQALGLTERFDMVVTSADVTRPKPDPEGALRILGSLGIHPDEAVFIGDSSVDQMTAQGAGIAFWAYQGPDLKARRHIHNFSHVAEELAGPSQNR
jgi:phosphoglycolate phosphatase